MTRGREAVQSIPPSPAAEAHRPHGPRALRDVPNAVLGHAEAPVDEDDRHLGQTEAVAVAPVLDLDQERIAAEAEPPDVYRLEHLPAEALEAARAVAHRQPRDDAGVGVRSDA